MNNIQNKIMKIFNKYIMFRKFYMKIMAMKMVKVLVTPNIFFAMIKMFQKIFQNI
jgi:hypothetical protein